MYRNSYAVWGDQACLVAERVFSRPKDYVNDIGIVRQGTTETIKAPAADQFEIMLSVFADHVQGISDVHAQHRTRCPESYADYLQSLRAIWRAQPGQMIIGKSYLHYRRQRLYWKTFGARDQGFVLIR